MPEPISEQTIRHVAKLARIELRNDDVARYTTQLADILAYVDQLREVDVSGIESMAHPLPMQNVLRDDVQTSGLPLAEVLRNAAQSDSPFFKVPKVIGGEEDSAG